MHDILLTKHDICPKFYTAAFSLTLTLIVKETDTLIWITPIINHNYCINLVNEAWTFGLCPDSEGSLYKIFVVISPQLKYFDTG